MAKQVSRNYNEAESQSVNLINKGTVIVGDITTDGDIRIDGELKGNIDVKGRLVIGTSGKIEGEISCKNTEISGVVLGKIKATELLTMKESARITGDIISAKLTVEPGSLFTGTCKMGDNRSQDEPSAKK